MWKQLERLDGALPEFMTARLGPWVTVFWAFDIALFAIGFFAFALVVPVAGLGITLFGVFALIERLSRVPTSWAMLLATVGFMAGAASIVAKFVRDGYPPGAWLVIGIFTVCVVGRLYWWRQNAIALAKSINVTGPCSKCGKFKGV